MTTKKRPALLPKTVIDPITDIKEADLQDGQILATPATKWEDFPPEDRHVIVQKLIIEFLDELSAHNHTIHIWAPVGAGQEIQDLWSGKISVQTGVERNDQDPKSMIYYPPTVEEALCSSPVLHTFKIQLTQTLEGVYRKLCEFAGLDPQEINNLVGIDLPTLKALFVIWQILPPAITKLLETDKRLIPINQTNKTDSGLFIPGQALNGIR